MNEEQDLGEPDDQEDPHPVVVQDPVASDVQHQEEKRDTVQYVYSITCSKNVKTYVGTNLARILADVNVETQQECKVRVLFNQLRNNSSTMYKGLYVQKLKFDDPVLTSEPARHTKKIVW